MPTSESKPVSNDDLSDLSRLVTCGCITELPTLDLTDTQVTDEGLAYIAQLSILRFLFLRRTPVTDAGLSYLLKLPRLEWLDLSETAVSDAGVRQLSSLPELTTLYLENTAVTHDAVWDLQMAFWPETTLAIVV